MPYLKISGGEWFVDVRGQGEAIIFLHGWGVNGRVWSQQVEYFSRHYQTVAVDFPGHGRSAFHSPTPETKALAVGLHALDVGSLAKDLQEIIQQLGIKQAHIVASSMGGLTAIKMLSLFKGSARSLTLVGALPNFILPPDSPYGLTPARLAKLAAQLRSDYPNIVRIFFRSLFTRQERESERYKWLESFRSQDAVPDRRAAEEFLRMIETTDVTSEWQALQLPVLLVNGEEDEICALPSARQLQATKPAARLKLFARCGHFPFLSQPQEFNQVLEDFWKEVSLLSSLESSLLAKDFKGVRHVD